MTEASLARVSASCGAAGALIGGLGLATVFGIVRQSDGAITVSSEPGRGTTFDVYFPATEPADSEETGAAPASKGSTGTETILIAEDDEGVRTFAAKALRARGYTVLEAGDGPSALAVAERHAGSIQLLITDLVMPGTGGRALAGRLSAARPDLKVILTSGYADEAIARHHAGDEGVALLRKPFTPAELADKVREALDRQNT